MNNVNIPFWSHNSAGHASPIITGTNQKMASPPPPPQRPLIKLFRRETLLLIACQLWAFAMGLMYVFVASAHRKLGVDHFLVDTMAFGAPAAIAICAGIGVARQQSQLIVFGIVGAVYWLLTSFICSLWAAQHFWSDGEHLCTAQQRSAYQRMCGGISIGVVLVFTLVSVLVSFTYILWFDEVWKAAKREEIIRLRYLKGRKLLMNVGAQPQSTAH